ncbi:MAG: hypothetical protein MUC73_07010 [Cyclobacteriaceae bacterium]|nr:hypothetical protein [Cyclobacteriaceae bacterium]
MNTNKNLNTVSERLRLIVRILLLIGGSFVAFAITSLELINTNMSDLFQLLTIS